MTLNSPVLDAFCLSPNARFKLPERDTIMDVLPKNSCGKVLKTVLRGGGDQMISVFLLKSC